MGPPPHCHNTGRIDIIGKSVRDGYNTLRRNSALPFRKVTIEGMAPLKSSTQTWDYCRWPVSQVEASNNVVDAPEGRGSLILLHGEFVCYPAVSLPL